MQSKFNYTNGSEFTLDGVDYVGYYHVLSEDCYTEKYNTSTSEQLTLKSTFATDLAISDYFRDRILLETISLPNNQDSITIGANEIVVAQLINTKLKLLAINNNYVYSKLFVGSTDVPLTVGYTAGVSANDTTFRWYATPSYTALAFNALSASTATQSFSAFDNVRQFVIMPYDDNTGYGILCISSTNLIGLTSNAAFSDISFVLNAEVYSAGSEMKCVDLQSITVDNGNVYITDGTLNGGQIFQYNADGFYNGDAAYANKVYLSEPIGGIGTASKNNKFDKPTIVCAANNIVACADSNNSCIKVFDGSFVWKRTVVLSKNNDIIVKDIKFREMDQCFYVLTLNQSTNLYYLTQHDNDFNTINTTKFEDILTIADVQFNKLAVSTQDSNVFYVTTDNTVYKKFFTKPQYTFAIYKREKMGQNPLHLWNTEYIDWDLDYFTWNYGNTILSDFAIDDIQVTAGSTTDNVFLLCGSRIIQLQDRTDYKSVLTNDNFENYSYTNVSLNPDEYVQAIVFNKEIYKIYSNILQIKNNILGRFYGQYDGFSVLQQKNYSYLTSDELSTINVDNEYDIFINDNEQVSVGVINRVFTKLYKIQEKLLNLTQANIINAKTEITNDNIMVID